MAKPDTSKRPGPKLEPHQVILKPLMSEKGIFQSEHFNQYTFKINPLATKTDVKLAVEHLFEVKVDKVATQSRQGKPRRQRFRSGRTKDWKKAVVKLKPDHKIDFF